MLILFDCDGVLIDSEIIAADVENRLLKEAGFDIDLTEFMARFAGLTSARIFELVGEELGHPLDKDLTDRVESEIDAELDRSLKMIDGVHSMLDQIDDPWCICSNSRSAYLQHHLSKFDLYDRFRPYIYSSREVGSKQSKPDPNVFLHAAKELDMPAGDCLVVEDSTHGVEAAVAAGMRPIGFTGGSHSYPGHAETLMAAGAETTVNRMVDLAPTINALKSWRLD